jgi:putative transposase
VPQLEVLGGGSIAARAPVTTRASEDRNRGLGDLRLLAEGLQLLVLENDGRRGRHLGSPDSRSRADALLRGHDQLLRLSAIRTHQATTLLTSRHKKVVGGSNVAGMVRDRRLAQSLSDQSLGRVRQQLEEKATWHGGRLLVADRFSPSSKTCSVVERCAPS